MSQPTLESELFQFTSGPPNAKIILVGESWGAEEAIAKRPFVGSAGKELDRMLIDAKLDRREILFTNLRHAKPDNNEMWRFFEERKTGIEFRGLWMREEMRESLTRLYKLIAFVRPSLIIACGNWPLWALCDVSRIKYSSAMGGRMIPTGIGDFRGSQLYTDSRLNSFFSNPIPVLPIYHPSAVMRDWASRTPTVHDLRTRVPKALEGKWKAPQLRIDHSPSFESAVAFLELCIANCERGPCKLACDIETRMKLITCIGFAPSKDYAMVIPFFKKDPSALSGFSSPWTIPQEAKIIKLLTALLEHPNVRLIGQNFLYDMFYFHHHWGIKSRCYFDTLLAHHLVFPGTSKGLGYLSSLYCSHHRYWKDDNHEWDAKTSMDEHFLYNGEDCIRTFEIYQALSSTIPSQGLSEQWVFEMEKNEAAFEMMLSGILIDTSKRNSLLMELTEAAAERQNFLLKIIPQEWIEPGAKSYWYSSPSQQKTVFYDLLQMKEQTNRKTGRVTLDKEAIPKLASQHPEFRPLFNALLELRSIGVFVSTFIRAPLSHKNRMHCSFSPAGTDTFRWSSSTNPVDEGTNLQNIPKGDEE